MTAQIIISSGILDAYAMGICTEEETLQVQQWLQQFPELITELGAIQSSVESYIIAGSIKPSDKVKEKIFASLNLKDTIQNSSSNASIPLIESPNFNYRSIWSIAASILLFLSFSATYIYYSKYKATYIELAQAKQSFNEIAKLNEELTISSKIVSNPSSIPISLNGLETMPAAKAKIFWVKESGDVFIDATNLPQAPEGKQYQFWAIVNGVPVNGGLIVQTKSGSFRLQRMKSFGKAEAFAISLEKNGGNPTPTTVVSIGKVI